MKAAAECFVCLLNQAIRTARVLGLEEDKSILLLRRSSAFLAATDFNRTPPEISEDLYRLFSEFTENPDPYFHLKRESIKKALELYPELEKRVKRAADPLRAALEISLAGNIIDFGASGVMDWSTMESFLNPGRLAIDHYEWLKDDLRKARKIVFLGDNAGETVFDRLLLEQVGGRVIYAVREKPIINDATLEEARLSRLDEVAELVSSGCQAPGTVLSGCHPDFLKLLGEADLILAKGQGNFECLEQEIGPFYFLLKAKCEVVARYLGVEPGSLVLTRSKNFSPRFVQA
ncbi:MAG: damage-control phosphatase ARMT1 family protein [Candidatus Saccharicenans sp.]